MKPGRFVLVIKMSVYMGTIYRGVKEREDILKEWFHMSKLNTRPAKYNGESRGIILWLKIQRIKNN